MRSWQNGLPICATLKDMESHISQFITLTQITKRKYTIVTEIYLSGLRQKVRNSMERLTNSDKEIPTLENNAEYWLKVYFKLKDYEDAEEQGRMIIFPCNKGDKLYEFYRECVEDRLGAGETPEDIINVRKVYGFEYEDDVLHIRASYHSNHSELWGGYGEDTPEFPVSEIGKTVFLTYEEAEAKLKEMEKKDV
nr:MAG TPA: hypothetical protein [Caudoviricetes sp.]